MYDDEDMEERCSADCIWLSTTLAVDAVHIQHCNCVDGGDGDRNIWREHGIVKVLVDLKRSSKGPEALAWVWRR